jgi:ABC-type antimicrobial peptide transport system permease subunit
VPVDEIAPLRVEANAAIAQERVLGRLSLVIGTIAGLLALAGLYAATAQFVGERTREYAIRSAIGATRADIAGAILGRVGRVAAVGLVSGAALLWPLSGLLAAYLFGVSRGDALTLATVALALSAAAVLAAWPAIRRARRVDPAVVLRGE